MQKDSEMAAHEKKKKNGKVLNRARQVQESGTETPGKGAFQNTTTTPAAANSTTTTTTTN